jgi:hypothetical protein
MLELDEGQLSRPVLRGGGGGNAASLPDYGKAVTGKGGKERTTPLHLEAVERLAAWLAMPGIADKGYRPDCCRVEE